MTIEAILFYVFGILAVVSALGMVLNIRNTVASAMSLVVTMVSLGAIYLLLEAYLVAAIQIMVYGGAIVVLFLFVVMLLNLSTDEFPPGKQRVVKLAVVIVGVLADPALGLLVGGLGACPRPGAGLVSFGNHADDRQLDGGKLPREGGGRQARPAGPAVRRARLAGEPA